MSVGKAIAVAVDGTEASRAALDFALGLARARGRALAGVFVIDAGWADFIGNDWQSSRNARQGFLDHMRREQEAQAALARRQFERAADLPENRFSVLVGDPAEALIGLMAEGGYEALVIGRGAFEACGRPSVRRLPRALARKVRQPVHLV